MTVQRVHVDFLTVREDWNEYTLDDGRYVKLKASPNSLFQTGEIVNKKMPFTAQLTTNVYVDPSPDDVGQPSENQIIKNEDIINELHFTTKKEVINIYDVPNKIIMLVMTKARKIRKTSKFNSAGNRIYDIDADTAISLIPYPDFKPTLSVTARL